MTVMLLINQAIDLVDSKIPLTTQRFLSAVDKKWWLVSLGQQKYPEVPILSEWSFDSRKAYARMLDRNLENFQNHFVEFIS